jgi:hypothetical protein
LKDEWYFNRKKEVILLEGGTWRDFGWPEQIMKLDHRICHCEGWTRRNR